MDYKYIQDNMCNLLSICSIPKQLKHQIINMVMKWIKCEGIDNVVKRLSDLQMYYEKFIGTSEPESLCDERFGVGLRRDGKPKGPFKKIFEMKDTAIALSVLSLHRSIKFKTLTQSQFDKFLKGINSNNPVDYEFIQDLIDTYKIKYYRTNVETDLSRYEPWSFHGEEKMSRWLEDSFPRALAVYYEFSNGQGYLSTDIATFYAHTERNSVYIDDIAEIHCGWTKEKIYSLIPKMEFSWHVPDALDERITGYPDLSIISTKSIPINRDGIRNFRIDERRGDINHQVAQAYAWSFYSLPWISNRFIRNRPVYQDLFSKQIVWKKSDGQLWDHNSDQDWSNHYHNWRAEALDMLPHQEIVGSIGIIQEPAGKARIVANPNKVTQWLFKPLANHLYGWVKGSPFSCAYRQEHGVDWIQRMLRNGEELSGVDLSSATDTLNAEGCVRLIESLMFSTNMLIPMDSSERNEFRQTSWVQHRDHFLAINSQGLWSVIGPDGKEHLVQYRTGQGMGQLPSFALLDLANSSLAMISCIANDIIPVRRAFSIGDDVCIPSQCKDTYVKLVTSLGGVINHSKTLTSNKVCEFAGRIIGPKRVARKKVKPPKSKRKLGPSFLKVFQDFGEKAKSWFTRKQKEIIDTKVKYIPGILVSGPFPKDSFGVPLELRINYFNRLSSSMDPKSEVFIEKQDLNSMLTLVYFSLKSKGQERLFKYVLPFTTPKDFQSFISLKDPQIETAVYKMFEKSLNKLQSFEEFIMSTYLLSVKEKVASSFNVSHHHIQHKFFYDLLPRCNAKEVSGVLQAVKTRIEENLNSLKTVEDESKLHLKNLNPMLNKQTYSRFGSGTKTLSLESKLWLSQTSTTVISHEFTVNRERLYGMLALKLLEADTDSKLRFKKLIVDELSGAPDKIDLSLTEKIVSFQILKTLTTWLGTSDKALPNHVSLSSIMDYWEVLPKDPEQYERLTLDSLAKQPGALNLGWLDRYVDKTSLKTVNKKWTRESGR